MAPDPRRWSSLTPRLAGSGHAGTYEGAALVCRAEAQVLVPDDDGYDEALASDEWRPLRALGTAVLRLPRHRLMTGDEPVELSLAPLAGLDPDTTLVRVAIRCVPVRRGGFHS